MPLIPSRTSGAIADAATVNAVLILPTGGTLRAVSVLSPNTGQSPVGAVHSLAMRGNRVGLAAGWFRGSTASSMEDQVSWTGEIELATDDINNLSYVLRNDTAAVAVFEVNAYTWA